MFNRRINCAQCNDFITRKAAWRFRGQRFCSPQCVKTFYNNNKGMQTHKKNKMLDHLMTLGLVTLLLIGLFMAATIGADRQEVKDCYQWQSWTEQYRLFTPSDEMKTMCEAHNILIK